MSVLERWEGGSGRLGADRGQGRIGLFPQGLDEVRIGNGKANMEGCRGADGACRAVWGMGQDKG